MVLWTIMEEQFFFARRRPAKGTLGLVTEAFKDIAIIKPAVQPSNELLLKSWMKLQLREISCNNNDN